MDLRKLELHSDYDAIEEYVRLARLQRSAALGDAVAGLIARTARTLRAMLVRIAGTRARAARAVTRKEFSRVA